MLIIAQLTYICKGFQMLFHARLKALVFYDIQLVDEQLRIEAAFFEAVGVLVMRLSNQGTDKKISLPK